MDYSSNILDINKLQSLLGDCGIVVSEVISNNKSSEMYVRTTFVQDDGFKWETVVPYIYRRSGLFIEDEETFAKYLMEIKRYFTPDSMKEWKSQERKKWMKSEADVTKAFFYKLLSFREETEFPNNNNPARRIQDIKDAGYTVASISYGRSTSRILLPIPLNSEMGYEIITKQLKNRIIRLLRGINAYEAKATAVKALIPDHKFSEVRWDERTKAESSLDMTDEEVIAKFQLLDNQRNLQKREVCRRCSQEGKRGVIYGIPFFYEGDENWPKDVPTVGKDAEKGCIGCSWYDIERWRSELLKKIDGSKD